MKNVKCAPVICICALFFAVVISFCGIVFSRTDTAEAAYGTYNTYISAYDINYEVRSDRSMTITETVTVSFDNQSYFTRYIPANAGEMIKNVKILELPSGDAADVYVSGDYLVLDLGGRRKDYEATYSYSYDYCLTRAQEGANILALTPIGSDFECLIENITLSFTLPAGYLNADCFVQYGDEVAQTISHTATSSDEKTCVEAAISSIEAGYEVRVDFEFEDGALSTYFDFSSLIPIIIAALVLAALIVLKFLFFNNSTLTPIINLDAPNKMNPLMMGKLIDNKVNSEDITSMIFYWADKGYLKIIFDKQDDPTLIRIVRNLPADAPDYEITLFVNLFKKGDTIRASSLTNVFYSTVEVVKKRVNDSTKGLFDTKSMVISIAFAILAGLIAAFAPAILGMATIYSTATYFYGAVCSVAGIGLYVLAQLTAYNKLKNSTAKTVIYAAGIALLGVLCCVLYCFIVPSFIISLVPKIILAVLCMIIMPLSVIIISRTPQYISQLNDIIGFRNYILYAEKDKLEAMLEEDPQFFYHVLPYAQVLNVSDIWEDKFKSLTVAPPAWTTATSGDVIRFTVYCSLIRNMRAKTTRAMVSRPSSSSMGSGGRSGGGHGSFGGHGGGGHGGGGIRFR